jgi:23S rRNA pseudouridine2457 synthase
MPAHRHFLMYKPDGYLSQFIGEKKKKFLGELYPFPEETMAIGRLDEQSEGLLLLTTDGNMSELIRGRSVEKEYYVQVDGLITPDAIARLQQGVTIGIRDVKYTTLPCRVVLLDTPPAFPPRNKKLRDDRHGPTSWISITITEGKFRQVRKMTAAVGFPTLRLVRVRVGPVLLGNRQPGVPEELNGAYLSAIFQASNAGP